MLDIIKYHSKINLNSVQYIYKIMASLEVRQNVDTTYDIPYKLYMYGTMKIKN